MKFSENCNVSILYHSTMFELDQCTNNGDLLSDRKKKLETQTHTETNTETEYYTPLIYYIRSRKKVMIILNTSL